MSTEAKKEAIRKEETKPAVSSPNHQKHIAQTGIISSITPTPKLSQYPYSSTSKGYVCEVGAAVCMAENCRRGDLIGYVTCQKCIGISNDALWRDPCSKCGRSRKVQGVIGKCNVCGGVGLVDYGGRFKVADADFPEKMTWYEAVEACEALGNGWRLPTVAELRGMNVYLHFFGKGNFRTDGGYWSSDVVVSTPWIWPFVDNGDIKGLSSVGFTMYKDIPKNVRLVKDF